jgi:molybdopterin-guanine dinucleotide biosynthesis protein A
VYTHSCLPAAEEALARGERRMDAFHGGVDVELLEPGEWQPFDPHGLLFSNLNTPEEFQRAQALLSSST